MQTNKKMTVKEVIDEMANDTKVTVQFPKEIGIELVQANELRHYELFQWLVILLAPIAIGFWTGYAVEPVKSAALAWSGAIFALVSILFIILAFIYRQKVFSGNVTKSILLKNFDC
jgi:membrane protein YdbS with pleckstrin-like domain